MPDRSSRRFAFALVALALGTSGAPARGQQGAVAQGLDNAGRAVKRGFQSAGQAVQGGFVKARSSVHSMEVVSRIYSRLHWDKTLTTSALELEVRDGGIAIVTGVVPDAAAKAKALSLTAETVGVAQVIDQVTVSAPGQAAPIVPGNPPAVVPGNKTVIIPEGTTLIVPSTVPAVAPAPAPARSRGDAPL